MNRHHSSASEDPTDSEAESRALTLLWLADSTPLSAAPAESLQQVRERLGLSAGMAAAQPRRWRMAALTGWGAAAAMLAAMLWQGASHSRKTPPADNQTALTPAPGHRRAIPNVAPPSADSPPAETAGTVQPITDAAELRRQIAELREALNSPAASQPGTHRPVIQEMHPPGSTAPAAGSERILEIIAGALEADLRRLSPNDTGEVIIESGWAKALSGSDTVFRHRRFPKDQWAEMGLLAGPGGQFFDPATGWLWSPDPEGSDYTGRAAPTEFDTAAFAAADPIARREGPAMVAASGYVVSAPGGQTIVAFSNLPAVPAGSTVSIAPFGGTSFINGELVHRPVLAGTRSFSIPASSYSTDGTWNFSGIIAANGDTGSLSNGFQLQVNSPGGTSSTILSTGGAR